MGRANCWISALSLPALALAESSEECILRRGRLRFRDIWCEVAKSLPRPCAEWPRQVGHAHADTQENLFDHLLAIWGRERPRTFIDVGASAVHGEHRNTSDVHYFRDRFPDGQTLAVETLAPLAEQLSLSFAARHPTSQLYVANVFLDVRDNPEPADVVLTFPPVVRGRTVRSYALISCCEDPYKRASWSRVVCRCKLFEISIGWENARRRSHSMAANSQ
mmetsp:Transcript_120098/g.384635  ORF Transcript_120098/g.384635 Transcript_120098/m.384635 type:complete len:220 (-) Transcript_120098:17-676(-)